MEGLLSKMNLDDRAYEQIVQEARHTIPKLIAQWTDENAHDPGITFLELFAWLTEMQQYYLNRVSAKSTHKFLKVLGARPKEATCARTVVTFQRVPKPLPLLSGSKLAAKGEVFEIETSSVLFPFQISKVIVRTETGSYDFSDVNDNFDTLWHPFGELAEEKSSIYLGFDEPLPEEQLVSLYFFLFEDYPVSCQPIVDQRVFVPPVELSWTYYGKSEGNAAWLPLTVVADETYALSQSGFVKFMLRHPLEPTTLLLASDKPRYWLCCTIEKGGYELPPKVLQVSLNTVSAVHRETQCKIVEFDGEGTPHQRFFCSEYLAYYGQVGIQVRRPDGSWEDWQEVDDLAGYGPQDRIFVLHRNPATKQVEIQFGDGQEGKIPPKGKNAIRLLLSENGFNALVGRSNGLPHQSFALYRGERVIGNTLLLQIGRKHAPTGEFIWEDWTRVEDFDTSTPEDRHFVWDAENGRILFGNNETGSIPEAAEADNIRLISCQFGGGVQGNINKYVIEQLLVDDEDYIGVAVTNPVVGKGGANKEERNEAILRVQAELSEPTRAVTNEDYERLVKKAPGVRVARVKVLPLYWPGLRDYPRNTAPGHVTVVVVPHSEKKNPVPSQGFLQTIRNHLEPYRLLTTELHVVGPEYIKVSVHANVVVDHQLPSVDEIVRVLNQYLSPFNSEGVKGWTFGRTVYRADIFGVLNGIKGVLYVEDVWIEADGKGISLKKNGDIVIPPHGLVYSGEHDIRLTAAFSR